MMMDKLFTLSLVALVAASLACGSPTQVVEDGDFHDDISQLALFETDDVEVAYLDTHKKVFSDFCLETRDDVKVYLRQSVNDAAMKVFNVIFNSVEDLEYDLSNVDEEDIEQSKEIIENSVTESSTITATTVEQPAAPAAAAAKTEAEVERQIEDNVDKVKKATLWSTLTDGVRFVINTIIDTFLNEATKRLAILRAQFKGENVREKIEQACDQISFRLKSDIEDKLSRVKRSLKRSGLSRELAPVVAKTNIDNVGCITTGRISKVARFCVNLKAIGPIVFDMLGF